MSEIERWVDADAPEEVRELFRAAHAERPRTHAVQKAIAAVGAASAAGTLATGAAAGVAPAAKLAVLKWGLGGVLSGLVVTGGVSLALDAAEPRPAPAPIVVSASEPAPEPPPRREPSLGVAPPGSASEKASPSAPAPRASAAYEPAPEADARLAAELRIIDRVRASVDAKDGARALAELARYDREFGRAGRLAPEARYLRLEALLLTEDRTQAAAQAKQILAEDPSSPHARRAESVLKQKP